MIQQSLGLVQAIYLSPLLLVKRTNDNPLVLVCSLPFRIIFNLFPRKFALRYQSDHKSKGSPNKAINGWNFLLFDLLDCGVELLCLHHLVHQFIGATLNDHQWSFQSFLVPTIIIAIKSSLPLCYMYIYLYI